MSHTRERIASSSTFFFFLPMCVFPKRTHVVLRLLHIRFGNKRSKSFSIFSGFWCRVQPSFFEMYATCVSTPIALTPYCAKNTFAVLRPTPGSDTSSSMPFGGMPLYFCERMRAHASTDFVLLRKKFTG